MAINKEQKNKKDDSNVSWVIKVFITTFTLSIFFSYISTYGVSKLNLLPAILILILVILVGILFDIIGVNFMQKQQKKSKAQKHQLN